MFGLMSNASGLKQRFGYTIILVYSLRGIRTEKYFFVAGKQEQIGMWVFEHNLQELSDKKRVYSLIINRLSSSSKCVRQKPFSCKISFCNESHFGET